MAHATAWLNFTAAQANHDLARFGERRCDYAQQAGVFHADCENARTELVLLGFETSPDLAERRTK